jgi:hypothetical protein
MGFSAQTKIHFSQDNIIHNNPLSGIKAIIVTIICTVVAQSSVGSNMNHNGYNVSQIKESALAEDV